MSTKLILVRHAETFASIDRRFAGSTDVECTEEGLRQAEALARRLRPIRIDALYASPRLRCRQTATAVADATGLRVREAEALRECDFGSWEGLTITDVARDDPEGLQRWLLDDGYAPAGGESWREVRDRAWGWWEDARQRHRDRTILAVSHGGPILALLREVLAAPYSSMVVLEIDPCSITVLQTRGEQLRVRLVNDTTHVREPLRERVPAEELPP